MDNLVFAQKPEINTKTQLMSIVVSIVKNILLKCMLRTENGLI